METYKNLIFKKIMKSKIILIALSITLLFGCKRDRDEEPEPEPEKSESPQPKILKSVKTIVNVYIENSASMIGYINRNTNFKTNTRELLTQVIFYYGKENVKVHLINSSIYPVIRPDYNVYVTKLTPKEFSVGDIYTSELNNVFKQILEKTSKNTLSILISDCIYSVKGNDDLSVQKTGIEQAYLEKSKKGVRVSSEIIKLNSQFNGTYFDKNSGKHSLKGEMRPYYMIAMGTDAVLSSLNTKIPFNDGKMLGYSNKLILTSNNYSNKIYYTLVKSKSDIGSYEVLKNVSSSDSKKGIENIEMNEKVNDRFTFTLAVDMKDIPITLEYAKTISNYEIQGNYEISKIDEYNSITSKKLKPTSLAMLKSRNKNPTHLITFKAKSKSYSDLNINLKNQIPSWVCQTNTANDTNENIRIDKTFGFLYLVEGINEANQMINPKSKYFFELNIKINK